MSARKSTEATLRDYKTRLLRVLSHLQAHLDDPLSLEQLAAVACFSPYHFHRVFKGMVGESLMAHVRRLRLERAAIQLKQSGRPVTDIALDAGFETHESFTRAFTTAFKLAPSRFRAAHRSVAAVPAPSGVRYGAGQPPANFKTRKVRSSIMKVILKTIEPMRVAFVRHTGPYNEVGAAWDQLLPLLGQAGWLGAGTLFIGICHDDPDVTPPEKIRYDACVTVDAQFKASGPLGVQTIPGGEYAVTTHFGSYQKLGLTYGRMFGEWLPRSGRELRSTPCFEIYLNDPESTEPKELLTDIYVPLLPQFRNSKSEV